MSDRISVDSIDRYRVARLATTSDGIPHVVPVVFVVRTGLIWIPIDGKPKSTTRLKRVRNIESNSRISLLVDVYDEDWQALQWSRVDGNAFIVDTPSDVARLLVQKYPQYETVEIGTTAIRIEPVRTSSWAMNGR